MLGRIIEIAEDKRHLSIYRGFMVVKSTGDDHSELGRVPLEDISAVIANAHGLSYTNNLLVGLAEKGAPFVVCSSNHNAVGMLLPIEGNFEQAHRIEAQISSTLPLKKKLWASIVKLKLQNQASVLRAIKCPDAPLLRLANKVKSGDPLNNEAQGARVYWKFLFGETFRRDKKADGLNTLLNYGYTILRATTARAVIAAGLHPSIGLHHSNDQNAMRLVDDLMEPFRPIVDFEIWKLNQKGIDTLSPETKKILALTMYLDVKTQNGQTPISIAIQNLATSLALLFTKEQDKLDLPFIFDPLDELITDQNKTE